MTDFIFGCQFVKCEVDAMESANGDYRKKFPVGDIIGDPRSLPTEAKSRSHHVESDT